MDDVYPIQRKFPRISMENPVLVRKIEDETVGAFSKTRDMGLGGCMFLNDETLGEGTVVLMNISVQGRILEARARVVYERQRDSRIEVGVEFLQIDPIDRVVLERLFEPD